MAQEPAVAITSALGSAWNAGDAVRWGEQFWPDARFVNVLGHVFVGREEIVAQHARIFTTIYKGSHLAIRIAHTQALGPDHLLVEAEPTVTGALHAPPGVHTEANGTIRARFVLVLERRAGEWRILFAQNTGYTPLPSPQGR